MLKTRVIPVLLIKDGGLAKGEKYKNPNMEVNTYRQISTLLHTSFLGVVCNDV